MPLIQTTSAAEDIRRLFRENQNPDKDQFPHLVTEHFKRKFASEDAFNQIPVLGLQRTPESFVEGELVVFYGMIQDTSLPSEFYLTKGSTDEVGGWGLPSNRDEDHFKSEDLRECNVFWAVSIPGLSPWAKKETLPSNDSRSPFPNKYPTADTPHIGVQLKIYDEALASPLRSTDVLALVGLLGSDPIHSNQELDNQLDVPTLHVLMTRPLPKTIIPRSFPVEPVKSAIQTIRGELIQWIASEGLDGDVVSAEWILLTLLARVQSKKPPILPLSLTLAGFPPTQDLGAVPALQHVLSLIFPLISTIPLSLNTLNQTSFCPESKDEDLQSGWLQIPKGSIVILNEGVVTEGTVSSKGVSNIRVIQEAMTSQSLEYTFPFSSYHFETDINFVVLTESKKSTFFETSLNIPFHKNETLDEAQQALYKSAEQIDRLSEEKLNLFRELVGGARVGKVVVGEDTGKFVEQDYVTERSTGQFSSDDLIQRMLMAKMVALSFHSIEVTIDHWLHAKDLERKIKSRK